MALVHESDILAFKATGRRFQPLVTAFPSIVMVDTTTRCNLACVHCPSSVLSAKAGFLADMNASLYYSVADQVAEFPDTLLRPFNSGEPLLRRDMADLVAYAKRRGIRQVALTSNGALLTARVRRALVDASLDELEVSIDAATAGTYQAVRRQPVFARVVENTLRYVEEAKRADAGRRVLVSFVAQPANLHEQEDFVRFWTGRVDAVYIRGLHRHHDLIDFGPRPPAKPSPRHPCPFIFERLIVNHDGRVRFCEFDWEAEHVVGDARTEPLKDIWQGAQYRRLRAEHVSGAFGHPYCGPCPDWQEVRWPGL
jgi:MoaA/NifB/PqqE/SkfB family radical SAM enzyme